MGSEFCAWRRRWRAIGRSVQTYILTPLFTFTDKTTTNPGIILLTSNLNTGKSSRGRLTITPSLTLTISQPPYYNDANAHDFAALNASATALLARLGSLPNSSVFLPPQGVPLEIYLREVRSSLVLFPFPVPIYALVTYVHAYLHVHPMYPVHQILAPIIQSLGWISAYGEHVR